jgi:hypothetical protein
MATQFLDQPQPVDGILAGVVQDVDLKKPERMSRSIVKITIGYR